MILMMMCALFPTVIFAEETDFGVGDTGTAEIAPFFGVSVYKSPNSVVESNQFPVGTAVNVLEAYVTENRHYVEATSGLMSGKKGYIAARKGDKNTLKSINITGRVDKTYRDKKAEQEAEKAAREKAESKYTHDIDLEYLADYMPGGAKSLDGKAITASYAKKPAGWEFHMRPDSLKLVGKAVLHIGDAGKQGKIAAAFYPGKPPKNYHQERLNDLIEIGYYIEYDAGTNSINMIGYFDYTEAGGELAKGDGVTKTAFASSAFLTYDGVPVSVACYNIDGNNYFKLRDVTDALDCRVEWNERNSVINIITTLSAKEDPKEAKG